MEELSASFGDRDANLLIKMSPPVVTTETIREQGQKPEIQFRLYDNQTDQNFEEVTYFITIEKDSETLLSNWFFDSKGNLSIQMQPRDQNQITVYGELDPIMNAYTTRGDAPVVAAGPIFLEGGLYHFIVRVVTVDFARTILPDDQQPVFEGWLSVGATKDVTLDVNGKLVPLHLISYYDELSNVTYDKTSNSINITMPFPYSSERIDDPDNKVFIHQEVVIPKPSPLSSTGGYLGYVNGKDVTNALVVDANNATKDVVHFLLAKPTVKQIVDEYLTNDNNDNNKNNIASPNPSNNTAIPNDLVGKMTFSLIPTQNGSAPQSGTLVCVPGLELCY
ncbi:MAG: hypothetical protein L0H55_10505 [Candidatus Nitrosocosmicus sp.]|nr:hypothetical protein [Candidatus Nitrosocosmicus sp.]